jgi:hypothetical protein
MWTFALRVKMDLKRAFLWAMVRDSDCEINGPRKEQTKVWMIVRAKKKGQILKL